MYCCLWNACDINPKEPHIVWPVVVAVVVRAVVDVVVVVVWEGVEEGNVKVLSPGYILTTLCPPGGPYIFEVCSHLGMQKIYYNNYH